jgi:alpha-glucosidase
MRDGWIWWKHGILYQIYPRSFYDSNGDGIGDIPGIIKKLDYLASLGIDGIWLSPVNRSPMHDFGYDISDYYEIDQVFGTNDDFLQLIEKAHDRGIRIIMDLVLNHTSHLHPWFLSSRSSRSNPKRNWYIWRDGFRNRPPNNWQSVFGGSAWKWDELTCQYYHHTFLEEQPDVNWRNKELQNAMFSMVKYWLDKGVDGFRLDVVNWLVKDARFRNNPEILGQTFLQRHKYDRNRPETHDILKQLRLMLNQYEDRMSVGEVFTLPPGDPAMSARFLGDGKSELHLAFDFSLMYRLWNAHRFYRCIRRWLKSVPENAWPCHVLSNHDQPRAISRYGSGKEGRKRAKVAAALLLTLRGTPFIYYGEEIGMKNTGISRSDIRDPLGKRFWFLFLGRDPARTPMQWSPEHNAEFTTGLAWLPVSVDFSSINVEAQSADRYSLLNFYKTLIALRKQKKALYEGDWIPVLKGRNGVLGYYRRYKNEKIFIVLNFTAREKRIHIHDRGQWKVLASTHRFRNEHFTDLRLSIFPYEATVFEKFGELV